MTKARRLTLVGVIILIVAGSAFVLQQRAGWRSRPPAIHPISSAEMIANARLATRDSMESSEARANATWARKREKAPSKPTQPAASAESELLGGFSDPIAYEALAYVGLDPRATEYWIEAINDPEMPASERQDLIENLRIAGFYNLQRPSPEELTVISNRILIIEAIASDALDETNADALSAVHRDLVQLAAALSQQVQDPTAEPDDATQPEQTGTETGQ